MFIKILIHRNAQLTKIFLFLVIHLLILSVAVSNLYSQDCYAPSPSYANGKSPFDWITVRNLTESEQRLVIEQFQSLSGTWEGEAMDEECKGGEESPVKKHNAYSIRGKVKVDRYGNLKLNTVLFSKAANTKHYEKFSIYLVDKKLRIDDDSGAGDVELINVTKNKIKFLKRYISGSLKREHFISINISEKSFAIEKLIYVQGRYLAFKSRLFQQRIF